MGRMYLFTRQDMALTDAGPLDLSYHVFFQMWTQRQHPYRVFAPRDTVFIANQRTRVVEWEVTVDSVLKFQYTSIRHALGALRAAYGMYAEDLNDYHRNRAGAGFLLAWAPRPTRQLNVPLAAGQAFGRNGFRELTDADLNDIGLPLRRRRVPLAQPPQWFQPSRATTGLTTPLSRYIPAEVRRHVNMRDGGRCVGCGTEEDTHFDHIKPFIHGGTSTVENLRILCGPSNLTKGSSANTMPACSR